MMFKLKSMQSPWPNRVIVRGSGFKPTTLQPLNFHAKYTVVGKSQSCTHAQQTNYWQITPHWTFFFLNKCYSK